jgi:hypothetical protein
MALEFELQLNKIKTKTKQKKKKKILFDSYLGLDLIIINDEERFVS